MTPNDFLQRVRGQLDFLEQTQLPAVEAAADLVIAAMTTGGTVNCATLGHGTEGDFIYRAGGLVAVQRFSYNVNVQHPVAESRRKAQPADPDLDLKQIQAAVALSGLRTGDVMLVSSVSGRNRPPIELALACRQRGVKVIGFTALAYTARIVSLHPSGKRLCDAVDVVIDIGAPYGDAAVAIAGYEHDLIPLSGIGMDVAGWMLWGRVMEKMAAAGTPPSVLISHNREGGPAFNDQSRARYQERGY